MKINRATTLERAFQLIKDPQNFIEGTGDAARNVNNDSCDVEDPFATKFTAFGSLYRAIHEMVDMSEEVRKKDCIEQLAAILIVVLMSELGYEYVRLLPDKRNYDWGRDRILLGNYFALVGQRGALSLFEKGVRLSKKRSITTFVTEYEGFETEHQVGDPNCRGCKPERCACGGLIHHIYYCDGCEHPVKVLFTPRLVGCG